MTSCGNSFAWKVVLTLYFWAFLSQKVPSKIFKGPPTAHGYVPEYADNGFQYYCVTLGLFSWLSFHLLPDLCSQIYINFGEIVQVLNITALLLCIFLMFKGFYSPETRSDPLQKFDQQPWPYLFYRGVELHPRIFGIDVKQVTKVGPGFNFQKCSQGGVAVDFLLQRPLV